MHPLFAAIFLEREPEDQAHSTKRRRAKRNQSRPLCVSRRGHRRTEFERATSRAQARHR